MDEMQHGEVQDERRLAMLRNDDGYEIQIEQQQQRRESIIRSRLCTVIAVMTCLVMGSFLLLGFSLKRNDELVVVLDQYRDYLRNQQLMPSQDTNVLPRKIPIFRPGYEAPKSLVDDAQVVYLSDPPTSNSPRTQRRREKLQKNRSSIEARAHHAEVRLRQDNDTEHSVVSSANVSKHRTIAMQTMVETSTKHRNSIISGHKIQEKQPKADDESNITSFSTSHVGNNYSQVSVSADASKNALFKNMKFPSFKDNFLDTFLRKASTTTVRDKKIHLTEKFIKAKGDNWLVFGARTKSRDDLNTTKESSQANVSAIHDSVFLIGLNETQTNQNMTNEAATLHFAQYRRLSKMQATHKQVEDTFGQNSRGNATAITMTVSKIRSEEQNATDPSNDIEDGVVSSDVYKVDSSHSAKHSSRRLNDPEGDVVTRRRLRRLKLNPTVVAVLQTTNNLRNVTLIISANGTNQTAEAQSDEDDDDEYEDDNDEKE